MSLPAIIPDPSPVYAGDDTTIGLFQIKPGGEVTDLSEGYWWSEWRPSPVSPTAITLEVDTTNADEGIFVIRATAEQTRQMDRSGVWDLQRNLDDTIVTWLRGETRYEKDVTRVD